MAEPYQLVPRTGELGVIVYEGPFGPLVSEPSEDGSLPGNPGIVVTGEHIKRAVFSWSNHPAMVKQEFSQRSQAIHGVTITIDGVTVRARIPTEGRMRSRNQIWIERPGENRILRLRRLRNYSLETETGTRLIYVPKFKWRGKVHPEADVIDVVVLMLLEISGIARQITPTYL